MTFSKRTRLHRARRLSIERFERRDLLTTLELLPVADNTLFEDASGSVSNGAGQYLFAGRIAPQGGGAVRRGLIQFDFADLPSNASINSVSLELSLSQTIAGDEPVSLHTVLASWGEGASDAPGEEGAGTIAQINDATWFHRTFPNTTWASAGGDFWPLASATVQVGADGRYTWSSGQLTTDVENWVSHPVTNFGWIIRSNELSLTTAKRFDSRENTTEANRPKLIIDFDVPDTTSPTPTIAGPASPTVSEPFEVTIDFGETVTGFVADDIMVGNGSVTGLVDNGAGTFTATIAPTAVGNVTVDIAAGVATDTAGNTNIATTQFSVMFVAVWDFGDAPTAAQSGFANNYPVTLAENGARHLVGSLLLGNLIDVEVDGIPTAAASGDGADDDGVHFVTTLIAAQTSTTSSLSVIASGPGDLDAWVDFNQDGDWDDVGEQILTAASVTAGENVVPIGIPAGAIAGATGARLRLSGSGGLSPTGAADDGEVEDYLVTILSGDSSPEVKVEMVGNALTVSAESGDIVIRSGQTERFRAPSATVGSLHITGTSIDDSVTLNLGTGFEIPAGGLQLAGGGGNNTLSIVGADGSIDLSDPAIDVSDVGRIDLSSEDITALTLDAGVVAKISPATKLIDIVAAEGDRIVVRDATNWRMTDPVIVDGQFHLTAMHQQGDEEQIRARVSHGWQNLLSHSDITNDGSVTALDALVIINELARQSFKQPDGPELIDPIDVAEWPGLYFDQNGDDRASALDALRVINALAEQSPEGEPTEADLIVFSLLQTESPSAVNSTRGDEPILESPGLRPHSIPPTSPLPSLKRDGQLIDPPTDKSVDILLSARNVDELLADDSFVSSGLARSEFLGE